MTACYLLVYYMSIMLLSVPLPEPTIANGRSAPLYAATSYHLTCDYTLHELIDTGLRLIVNWWVDGSPVNTSQSRITALDNTLVFNPLATSDSGSYVCTLTLPVQEYVTVLQPEEQQSLPVDITVEGDYTGIYHAHVLIQRPRIAYPCILLWCDLFTLLCYRPTSTRSDKHK